MAPAQEATDVAASVAKLTIDPNKAAPPVSQSQPAKTSEKKKKKKKKDVVVDSWEDEELSDEGTTPTSPTPRESHTAGTAAPPPTPITPSYRPQNTDSFDALPSASSAGPASSWLTADDAASGSSSQRPEKTDAVARRMIAGALGVRIPKQTEEQKAYEKSIREAERKRREDERAARERHQEEQEAARKAIWDD